MGEIKSTMDLVMEKTRHLSMSEEEKSRQQRLEFQKRLQGLLLKFENGSLTMDELRKAIATLQSEMKVNQQRVLLQAVFDRVEPGRDNQRWLDVMVWLAPGLREPLQKILGEYRKQETDLVRRSERQGRLRLAENYDIRGTAVMPNPEQDAGYEQSLSALQSKMKSGLDDLLHQF